MHHQNIVLFDTFNNWQNLLPLTATRAIADIKVGILTIKEKWQKLISTNDISILSIDYLDEKYKYKANANAAIFINSSFLPNIQLWSAIEKLNSNEALVANNQIIAFINTSEINNINDIEKHVNEFTKIIYLENTCSINYPWNIFKNNGQEIRNDIKLMQLKPNPDALSKTNILLGNDVYVMENVICEASTLNTKDGPIFLDNHSEIMEGCTIRAPFALGEHSTLKMQAKIYGDTSIGQHCKIGGEVSNSVIFGYSNKAHDGFLGNAVIGEWCNLGADTNNSNLKNNYSTIKVWNYSNEDYIESNLQFSGLIMGDHAKAAINTQFNTGTVVGVCANIFDAGFSAKFIPDFSWGRNATFSLDTAFEVAQRVMERRSIQLTEIDKKILSEIFYRTAKFRKN